MNVKPEEVFWLNGKPLKNLKELEKALTTLDEHTFYNHVNSDKNDFYNWILHCIKDKKLAQAIKHAKQKNLMTAIIQNHLKPQKATTKKAPKKVVKKKVEKPPEPKVITKYVKSKPKIITKYVKQKPKVITKTVYKEKPKIVTKYVKQKPKIITKVVKSKPKIVTRVIKQKPKIITKTIYKEKQTPKKLTETQIGHIVLGLVGGFALAMIILVLFIL